MTESKDERKPEREPTEAELKREIIEAVARSYFAMCRKLARLVNRKN